MNQLSAKEDDSIYLIAEAGVNHDGDLSKAREMVYAAAEAGCNSIKFQAYRADKLAAIESPSYWDTRFEITTNQRTLFAKYDQFSYENYFELAELSDKLQIDFSLSIFDVHLVKRLAPLCRFLKIASADITNYQLLKSVSEVNLPLIVSTGAASLMEVENACRFLRVSCGFSGFLAALHCVLHYPCRPESANLARIGVLRSCLAGVIDEVGYSDHVPPSDDPTKLDCCVSSVLAGAKIVETHFTLDSGKKGNDHYHSYDPDSIGVLKLQLAEAFKIFGNGDDALESQKIARQHARRGLYLARNVKKGERLTAEDIVALRPCNGGIPAQDYWEIIGSEALQDLSLDQPLMHFNVRKDAFYGE